MYDFQLAGTAAKTYAASSDGAGGTLIKASTTVQVPAAQPHAGLTSAGPSTLLFAQAMASFGVPDAPQGGYAASATFAATPMLTPVGSAAAAGAAWHGG